MRSTGMLGAGLRVLRFPAADRRRALEAAAQVTRASLELRLLPASRTVALLGRADAEGGASQPSVAAVEEAALVGAAVDKAARRLPWHPTCLRQALATQRMLRRRRIPARLHLGVTGPRDPSAHAWVTVGERAVIGGSGLDRYVPLTAFD